MIIELAIQIRPIYEQFKKIIINTRCSRTRISGGSGIDKADIAGFVDIVHDLDKLLYLLEDNVADKFIEFSSGVKFYS